MPVEIFRNLAPDFSTRTYRSPLSTPAFDTAKNNDTVSSKRDDTDAQRKTTRVVNREGLKILRELLKTVGFHSKTHFKVDPKVDIGAVWIRQYRSSQGVAREVAGVKSRLSILDDAVRMERGAFRERLERFLIENGFEMEGGNS